MHFPDQIDLALYERVYPEFADALQTSHRNPSPGELEFMAKVARTELPPGNVGPANLCFLAGVTSALRATRIIEIGTASGTSTALLAAIAASSLRELGRKPVGVLVDTIDKKSECLFDRTKPIGYMVAELVPELAAHVRVRTNHDSFAAREFNPRGSVELAFIDGNHQHPWPLIDVLNLLPLVRAGAWFVLHDIDLPAVAARLNLESRYGAQWLFQRWPAASFSSGNIGAVQVPHQPRELQPFLRELATRQFEVAESGWKRYRRMLDDAFAFAFGA